MSKQVTAWLIGGSSGQSGRPERKPPKKPRIVYSNIATSTDYFRNAADTFVWDDLELEGGGLLSSITLAANNSRPTPQPGSLIELEFRLLDGPDGAPGTVLGTVSSDQRASEYSVGTALLELGDLAGFHIRLPRNGSVAVGVNFHDPTRSMGVLTFDPPTVGGSSPGAWIGEEPTAIVCEGIVGHPTPCSFGWQLKAVVPHHHHPRSPHQR